MSQTRQRILSLSIIVLCGIVVVMAEHFLENPSPYLSWLLYGLVALIAGLPLWQPIETEKEPISRPVAIAVLLIILSVAAFMRWSHLDSAPYRLGPDEDTLSHYALMIAYGGEWLWPTDLERREVLFNYLLGLSCKLFGVSIYSLRLVPRLIGMACILLLYFLSKRLFNRTIGLLSAAFMAVALWSNVNSRTILREVQVPLFVLLSFHLWFRAIDKRRPWDYFLCGFFLIGGYYTYPAYRPIPAVIFLWLLCSLAVKRGFLKTYWWGILLFLSAVVLVFYFTLWPYQSLFFNFHEPRIAWNSPQFREMLSQNLYKSGQVFFVRSDFVRYAGRSMNPALAGCLVFGLGFMLGRWFHDRRYLFLFLWCIFGPMVGILTEIVPRKCNGVQALLYILMSFGPYLLIRNIVGFKHTKWKQVFSTVVIVALCMVLAYWNWNPLFIGIYHNAHGRPVEYAIAEIVNEKWRKVDLRLDAFSDDPTYQLRLSNNIVLSYETTRSLEPPPMADFRENLPFTGDIDDNLCFILPPEPNREQNIELCQNLYNNVKIEHYQALHDQVVAVTIPFSSIQQTRAVQFYHPSLPEKYRLDRFEVSKVTPNKKMAESYSGIDETYRWECYLVIEEAGPYQFQGDNFSHAELYIGADNNLSLLEMSTIIKHETISLYLEKGLNRFVLSIKPDDYVGKPTFSWRSPKRPFEKLSMNMFYLPINNKIPEDCLAINSVQAGFSYLAKPPVTLKLPEELLHHRFDKVGVDRESNFILRDFHQRQLFQFDNQGNFIRNWGEGGVAANSFHYGFNFDVNSKGEVLVLTSRAHGTSHWQVYRTGSLISDFHLPTEAVSSVALGDNNRFYLCDGFDCFSYTLNGQKIWGAAENPSRHYRFPRSQIALSREGRIYVFFIDDDTIVSYTSDGKRLDEIRLSRFVNPGSLAFTLDSSQNFVILDTKQSTLKVFNEKGIHLLGAPEQGYEILNREWLEGAIDLSADHEGKLYLLKGWPQVILPVELKSKH